MKNLDKCHTSLALHIINGYPTNISLQKELNLDQNMLSLEQFQGKSPHLYLKDTGHGFHLCIYCNQKECYCVNKQLKQTSWLCALPTLFFSPGKLIKSPNLFWHEVTKGGSDLVWYSIDRDIFKTESIFLQKKNQNKC